MGVFSRQPALPLQSTPPKPGRSGELHPPGGLVTAELELGAPSCVLAPPRGNNGVCTDGSLRVAGLLFQLKPMWAVAEPVPAGCVWGAVEVVGMPRCLPLQ